MVLVGDNRSIYIPELPRSRMATGRLRGLRLLHTHLSDEALSQEDLMDMVFLRLDSVAALNVRDGFPETVQAAHLLPPNPDEKSYEVFAPVRWDRFDLDLGAMVDALEDEFRRQMDGQGLDSDEDRALLVSVDKTPRPVQELSLEELAELADTAGLTAAGTMIQRVRKHNPKFIMGKGKLAELEVRALQANASIIIFRPGVVAHPDPQPGAGHGAQDPGPHPAHPRHFRPARHVPLGQAPGGDGPAQVHPAALWWGRTGPCPGSWAASAGAVPVRPSWRSTVGGPMTG